MARFLEKLRNFEMLERVRMEKIRVDEIVVQFSGNDVNFQ